MKYLYGIECKFCNRFFKKITKYGLSRHEKCCIENPNRVPYKGHKITNETKEKISKSLKEAYIENRHRGWANTKQNQNGMSYPEKWFLSIIQNEFDDKNFEYNLPFYRWKIDFAWRQKMLCIEIDGSQHENEKQRLSDLEKDKKLKENGWTVLRLPWSFILKNKKQAILIAKNFIDSGKVSEVIWFSKKDIQNQKRKQAELENRINSLGRIGGSCLSNDEWENRKNIILNCGVDLNKFGWISKVSKKTGLTKKQIYNIIKKFNLNVFSRSNQTCLRNK